MAVNRIVGLAKSYFETPTYLLRNITWRFPNTISGLELVFVIGAPRSGTTLLQKILESHSVFFSIPGETGLFSYQNIFHPARRHFGYSHKELISLYDRSADIVDFFDTCVRNLPQAQQGKVFIEKTPQHALKLTFLLRYFPQAKFIHIVRDGRDCYCSSKDNLWVPQRKSVYKFAKYWKKCVREALLHSENNRLLTLKYEELTTNPKYELQNLMHFMNFSVEDSQLDSTTYGQDKRAHLSEFQKLSTPISSSSVGRWKQELTQEEVDIFYKLAKEELHAYGYL